MTDKEKFVLNITFQRIGLSSKEAITLINTLESRNKTYGMLIEAIRRLQDYFRNEKKWDSSAIKDLLKESRIYECSINKIKTIEDVFTKRDYSEKEQQQVARFYSPIFTYNAEYLDKKLLFYNDIKIKNILLEHPRNFLQGLKLTYARHHFLTEKDWLKTHQKIYLQQKRNLLTYMDPMPIIRLY